MMELYIGGLGVIAVVISLLCLLNNWQVKRNGFEVDSIVIRTDKKPGRRGSINYFPIFQYEIDGEQFEKKYSFFGHSKQRYADGEIVRIYCHKKSPKRILVRNDIFRLWSTLTYLVIGILLIALAVI